VQSESAYALVRDSILLFTEKIFYRMPDKMNKLLLLALFVGKIVPLNYYDFILHYIMINNQINTMVKAFSVKNYFGNLLIFIATLASTNATKCYQCTDCAAEANEDDLSECADLYMNGCYITQGKFSSFYFNTEKIIYS